jgi:hypothetical protein
MATSWLKARTPLLASRLFLGCAFAGTESSDIALLLQGQQTPARAVLNYKHSRAET